MIWLYRVLFLPALMVALPRYLRRMWRRGGYKRDMGHRFGALRNVPPPQKGVKRIWIQAVSVGELLAIDPLLRRLAERDDCEIVLTTTTSTGRALAAERYADLTVWQGIFPLDFVLFSRRTWNHLAPDLAILMESELWPEHLHQARRRGTAVLLLNARMSDRSRRRYERFRFFARPLLGGLRKILAASELDRERFAALGLEAALETSGNLKFDFDPVPATLTEDEGIALRAETGLPAAALIIVGASTWPGEEWALAQAVQAMRARGHEVALLLVPRHAERREEIARELAPLGFSTRFRSTDDPGPCLIYVADTTGELRRFIQLADIAYIGKSLPPHTEGQTPIEAAAYKKSIVFGPGMSNFRMITRDLSNAGGALTAHDGAELERTLEHLATDATARLRHGAAAGAVFARHRGATDRTVRAVEDLLRACGG